MRVQPGLVVKIHLPDLKLHTAEALSILPDGRAEQAGLLTYNGFHPLPAFRSGYNDENFCVLLTVARQSVICTRFPINSRLSKTFSD